MTVSGLASFKGPVTVACHNDEPGVITVEGRSPDYFLRFSVHAPRKGTHKIVMEGLTPGTPAYARFDVFEITRDRYVVPSGDVTIEDDDGRTGTLRATHFTKSGGRLEPIDLTVEARWSCR